MADAAGSFVLRGGGGGAMNWAEFFYMGGYAFYVWTSFGLALIVLSGNVVWAASRKRRILNQLKRRATARGERS